MLSSRADVFVTGLVLGAGGSKRLGRPKQLLPYGDRTLLDHTLATARACHFGQLVVPIGGAAAEVRERVDLSGAEVVENYAYGSGCSSSIAAALSAVDPQCEVLVLVLGDHPGGTPATVQALLDGRGDAALAVCRYDDGRGHPLAFDRSGFDQPAALPRDKGRRRRLDERADEVVEVTVPGPIPLDVDTPEDYEAALSAAGF